MYRKKTSYFSSYFFFKNYNIISSKICKKKFLILSLRSENDLNSSKVYKRTQIIYFLSIIDKQLFSDKCLFSDKYLSKNNLNIIFPEICFDTDYIVNDIYDEKNAIHDKKNDIYDEKNDIYDEKNDKYDEKNNICDEKNIVDIIKSDNAYRYVHYFGYKRFLNTKKYMTFYYENKNYDFYGYKLPLLNMFISLDGIDISFCNNAITFYQIISFSNEASRLFHSKKFIQFCDKCFEYLDNIIIIDDVPYVRLVSLPYSQYIYDKWMTIPNHTINLEPVDTIRDLSEINIKIYDLMSNLAETKFNEPK